MADSPDLTDLLGRPALEVAPRLLGAVVAHGGVAVRLTEVEAYDGAEDPGSHAYRGRTDRNAVMFGPAAHLYVYFTYGMHHCCNVVTGPEGQASAVLLRAGEVVSGLPVARRRRPAATKDRDLARGPARLCRALDIDAAQDGTALVGGAVTLTLPDRFVPEGHVRTGPRVGLRGAPDRPWRFWVADEPTVSSYRPARPRNRGTGR
ncbi:DNA-3-methyladenine glycosylase [Nocardioides euryhalodurans]|uniref:Putative 3-methyladenine DNA glycosylase n=1 Tax=Nocardioides euryhalodurans TaxID=2518370 RepID=A0A4P7GHY7_9ACTN|nr:DNA-3-methyladenine glycosylase [Nocardioides euryhalodurans]QBR91297.1 DNA-3-methyladenine glycosylase [Nocardioides euryhalodurans]